jgi:hypothetical protein
MHFRLVNQIIYAMPDRSLPTPKIPELPDPALPEIGEGVRPLDGATLSVEADRAPSCAY